MNKLTASVAPLVIAILSSAPNAHAIPITYDISGVASGEIGATTFTNASVELTGIGDTPMSPLFSVARSSAIRSTRSPWP